MTAYEMRISDWSSDVCSSDLTLDFDAVLPSIAEVVEVVEGLAAHSLQRLSEGRLSSIERATKAVGRIRDTEARAPEGQLPQMAIRPSQRFLEGSMQTIEPDAERHFDSAAPGRCHGRSEETRGGKKA